MYTFSFIESAAEAKKSWSEHSSKKSFVSKKSTTVNTDSDSEEKKASRMKTVSSASATSESLLAVSSSNLESSKSNNRSNFSVLILISFQHHITAPQNRQWILKYHPNEMGLKMSMHLRHRQGELLFISFLSHSPIIYLHFINSGIPITRRQLWLCVSTPVSPEGSQLSWITG